MERFDLSKLVGKKVVDIRRNERTNYIEFTFDDGSMLQTREEWLYDGEGMHVDAEQVPTGKFTAAS